MFTKLESKVIPNIVGVDIGCRMFCAYLGKVDIEYEKLDNFIKENIPRGMNVNETKIADFDLIKLISNKMYNEGEKISHGLINDVVDSIVVEEDHFEWKFNIFNDILKLNLKKKKLNCSIESFSNDDNLCCESNGGAS